jgi:hypothetical protein
MAKKTFVCTAVSAAVAAVVAAGALAIVSTVAPSSFSIRIGSYTAGNAASLAANDGDYFAVESTHTEKRKLSWMADFMIPSGRTPGMVDFRGLTGVACVQTIRIRDWKNAMWVTLDMRTLGTVEMAITGIPIPGSHGRFVNGSDMARIRIDCLNKTSAYIHRTDQLTIALDPAV